MAAGPVADILLDFVNGVYRVDGVSYASAALAGFTGTGTFDSAGYTATGTQVISGSVTVSGDYIVFSEFVQSSPVGVQQLWRFVTGGTPQVIRITGAYAEVPDAAGTSSSCTRIASGISGGLAKASFGGGAVTTGAAPGVPATSGTFYIGNTASPFDIPWGVAIEKIAIYKQTLTDAQIQALGA